MGIGSWFSFAGRIRRRTWWLAYVLPIFAISVLGTVIDVSLGFVTLVAEDAAPADGFAVATHGFGPFSIVALLVTIVGGLAGQVKRWHDRDKSGWWALIALIPIVGPIWALVELGFLSGTDGPNRFGPDPRGGAGAPQWQPAGPQGWQPGPPQWQQPPAQPQWQPPPAQGWQPPAQGQGQGAYPPPGWQPPPQGYPPPQQGYGQPPPGYGQPPPGYGQPPPGYGQPQQPPGPWQGPGPGGGSVPPVRRD